MLDYKHRSRQPRDSKVTWACVVSRLWRRHGNLVFNTVRTRGRLRVFEHGIGFGYVMNKMELGIAGDPRTSALIDAVYASL